VLRLSQQQDGTVTLSGVLDPVGGAALRAALEPLAQKSGKEDERGRERRLADALVELSHHAMDQATPRQRPHLNITATLGTLCLQPGSAAAELDYGMPVSELTLNRLACDCAITRHVFGSGSVLVELGREKRVISPEPGSTDPRRRLGAQAYHLAARRLRSSFTQRCCAHSGARRRPTIWRTWTPTRSPRLGGPGLS